MLLQTVGQAFVEFPFVEPPWLAWHHEAREALGTSLIIASSSSARPAPRPAKLWYALGADQWARKAAGAARRSFRRALRSERRRGPQLTPYERSGVLMRLGLLELGPSPCARTHAIRLLRSAREADASDPLVYWHLGLALLPLPLRKAKSWRRAVPAPRAAAAAAAAAAAEENEAVALLRFAVAETRRLGRAPRSLAMDLPRAGPELGAYDLQLEADVAAFSAFCAASPALGGAHAALRRALPAALADLKALVDDDEWLVRWSVETVERFGPRRIGAAYGEMPFESWRAVVTCPAVASALAVAVPEPHASEPFVSPPPPRVVICGCALGYLALFFRALGAHCVGVDLLADSMVGCASTVLRRHGLCAGDRSGGSGGSDGSDDVGGGAGGAGGDESKEGPWEGGGIILLAADALACPLVDPHSRTRPNVVWLNDEAWPRAVRRAVLARAARALGKGGVVVSWGEAAGSLPRGLRLVERVSTTVSWQVHAETLRILVKT